MKLFSYLCCNYNCMNRCSRAPKYAHKKKGLVYCSRHCAGLGNLYRIKLNRERVLYLMAL